MMVNDIPLPLDAMTLMATVDTQVELTQLEETLKFIKDQFLMLAHTSEAKGTD